MCSVFAFWCLQISQICSLQSYHRFHLYTMQLRHCGILDMFVIEYFEYVYKPARRFGPDTSQPRVLVVMHSKSVTTHSHSICFVEAKHIDEWRQVFTLDALPSYLAQYLTTGLVHQLAITAWEESDWSRLLLLAWAQGMLGHVSVSSCVWVTAQRPAAWESVQTAW